MTHDDAHADLGLGDAGYVYLLTDLLFHDVEDRQNPVVGSSGLNDGNHLAFAIACLRIGDLVYVYGAGGGATSCRSSWRVSTNVPPTSNCQRWRNSELDELLHQRGDPVVSQLEPTRWEDYRADEPFDFVCLTRSPPYAPVRSMLSTTRSEQGSQMTPPTGELAPSSRRRPRSFVVTTLHPRTKADRGRLTNPPIRTCSSTPARTRSISTRALCPVRHDIWRRFGVTRAIQHRSRDSLVFTDIA